MKNRGMKYKVGQTVSGWQIYEYLGTNYDNNAHRYRAKRVACGHIDDVTSYELVTGQRTCNLCEQRPTYEAPKEWLVAERARQAAELAEQQRQAAAQAAVARESDRQRRRRELLGDWDAPAPAPPKEPEPTYYAVGDDGVLRFYSGLKKQ